MSEKWRSKTYREYAREAICRALEEGEKQRLEGKELQKYVATNGYPFGPRKYYPYRVWLDEMVKLRIRRKRPKPPKPRPDGLHQLELLPSCDGSTPA